MDPKSLHACFCHAPLCDITDTCDTGKHHSSGSTGSIFVFMFVHVKESGRGDDRHRGIQALQQTATFYVAPHDLSVPEPVAV